MSTRRDPYTPHRGVEYDPRQRAWTDATGAIVQHACRLCEGVTATQSAGTTHTPFCAAQYDGIPRVTDHGSFVFTCTLARGHAGKHEDHLSDAPATLAWDTPRPRGRAAVCGDCWHILRPDEYEPDGGNIDGECSLCGALAWTLHRVAWREIDQYNIATERGADAWADRMDAAQDEMRRGA